MEGGLAVVGSASKNSLGRGFQQTEAMGDARDALARQLGTKVKNMFKKFARTTGVGESQSIEKVATNVSKQITSQNIEGARQTGRWVAPDGTLYLRVVLDPASVDTFKGDAKNAIRTSLKNNEALYQQFIAKKGFEELDAELEKELGGVK
jgi:LPS sulfotransferase NodH